MDIPFKSLRMNFHLFVVMVICIELIEGMGLCKFQEKFPNALVTPGNADEIKTTDSPKETSTFKPSSSQQQSPTAHRDCNDVYTSGSTKDGIYHIKPTSWTGSPFEVFCNMSISEGWTVFQRRVDGSVDFNRNWENYTHGFGDLSGSFWLGNEKLYHLTNQRSYKLRVTLVHSNGLIDIMEYDLFRTGDRDDKYRLETLGNFIGYGGIIDFMRVHEGQPFRTKDSDNNNICAKTKTGAWWYPDGSSCGTLNLNGDYEGETLKCIFVTLYSFCQPNIRYTEMRVRPIVVIP